MVAWRTLPSDPLSRRERAGVREGPRPVRCQNHGPKAGLATRPLAGAYGPRDFFTAPEGEDGGEGPPDPGRRPLGVVRIARVTGLPIHWGWRKIRSGGASAQNRSSTSRNERPGGPRPNRSSM